MICLQRIKIRCYKMNRSYGTGSVLETHSQQKDKYWFVATDCYRMDRSYGTGRVL